MANGKTVLIVDDEPDAIAFIEVALGEIGELTTVAALDGPTGLAKAREVTPDLVILDVQMPGRNGFEVFQDLKKDPSTRDVPVIMLTGVAEKTGLPFSGKDMGDFLGKEPEAYIEKPVEPEELQKTVASLLGL